MFKIPYGLYVIMTTAGGKDNGCISNTLEQVTFTPNQVSVCLNKTSLTCEMVQKSKIFTASIISVKADFELFKRFGFQTGRDIDKCADFPDLRRVDNGTYAVHAAQIPLFPFPLTKRLILVHTSCSLAK